jgi:hypothetical protein
MSSGHDPTTWLGWTGIAAAVLLVVGVSGMFRRWRMRRLLPALDGESGELKGFDPVRLVGSYRGRAVEFRQEAGGRNTPSAFQILLDSRTSLPFRAGREGAGVRFAKRLHLMKDLEVGEAELDATLTFQASEPERFRGWLQSSGEARGAITTLFAVHSAASLEQEDARLSAVWKGRGCWPAGPDEARGRLELLRTLAESAERA